MSGVIDLIVPTIAGREESLERCLASYERNTGLGVLNVIVVRDEPTCGRAWSEGLDRSVSPYVHLTCDDIEATSPTWVAVSIEAAETCLPCPIIRTPAGELESCGGDRARPTSLITELQPDETAVEFTPLPFMSREQAEAIGMIESHYLSDVWVSVKGREHGWTTRVVHGYEFVHHYEAAGRISSPKRRRRDRAIFEAAQ